MRPELASPTAVPGTEPVRTVATHCPYCALQCGMGQNGDRGLPGGKPAWGPAGRAALARVLHERLR